ncbi:hypothetical protein LIP_0830 [Limnochorda pilosa]|uniref:DNA 3'-5' helicase n=1 Tax=Limnochorda pilosa TaxID=1555112 RepID=A0A0K2SI47_LIMPI|nr:hypothetical protein LIP_0830 [Limnochorda pilosa]
MEDLDTCFLVEAGAGSGKTHSLVSRMVSLIASGRAQTEGLAAITFTRKAAAELRERFQIRLEQAASSEPDPGRRARLQAGVATLDRAFLGTIHAFCARLLRERPVEAGLDPAFQEIDEEEDGRWARAAWEAYLERVRRDAPERLEALRDLGVEPRELFGLFLTLHGYPDVEPVVADAPRPDVGLVRQELLAYVSRARARLPRSEPAKGWDALQKRIRRISQEAGHLPPGDDVALIRLLETFDVHPRPTLNRWADPDTAREALAAFESFRDGTALPTLRAWRGHVHGPAVAFVRPAVELAARMREQAGVANFQDLLLRAARLLRDDADVRRSLAGRYTHVLVDEFQDTDPIQAEVLFLLTGEPLHETDWHHLTPRPGSLFVVGDPKQSIYRFRRADIEVYHQVKQRLLRGGGEVLHLTANFRSVEPLIAWVNRVFAGPFPDQADRYQAAYVPLTPVRAASPGTPALAAVPVPPVPHHTRADVAREDAARVASWIAWACGGGLELERSPEERARGVDGRARPGDFLVLHRDRAYLLAYAEALEARGIPAEVTGAKGYAGAWEVAAFLDLLGLLADPSDPVKLLAVLRGPLFGLNDGALYRLGRALDQGWTRWLEAQVDGLPDPGKTALGTLRAWHAWTESLPTQAALEQILDATGLLPWTAVAPAGAARAGNLVKLAEVARAVGSGLSFPGMVEALRHVVETQELEAGSLFPGRPQAVRVMNLHRAKGLEAPVVVLAHPVGATEHEPSFHIRREWGGARGRFVVRAPSPGSGNGWGTPRVLAIPPRWDEAAAEEARYQQAEETRLLYVAATRARQLLVVSRYLGKPELSPWHPLEEGGALDGVPELQVPEGAAPAGAAPSPEQVEVAPEIVEAALRRTEEALAWARRPSSLHVAAGELAALAAGSPPDGTGIREVEAEAAAAAEVEAGPMDTEGAGPEPRGLAWGEAAHRLLELVVVAACRRVRGGGGGRGSGREAAPLEPMEPGELRGLARHTAREAGLEPQEGVEPEELLARWMEAFLRSSLWCRLLAADQVEVEVPLALALTAGELARLEPQAGLRVTEGIGEATPVVVQGQADLLFREDEAWVLVDYKTDRAPRAGEEGLAALAARYGPQVRAYAEAWRRATGQPVRERWLYLVRYGRAVAVP